MALASPLHQQPAGRRDFPFEPELRSHQNPFRSLLCRGRRLPVSATSCPSLPSRLFVRREQSGRPFRWSLSHPLFSLRAIRRLPADPWSSRNSGSLPAWFTGRADLLLGLQPEFDIISLRTSPLLPSLVGQPGDRLMIRLLLGRTARIIMVEPSGKLFRSRWPNQ